MPCDLERYTKVYHLRKLFQFFIFSKEKEQGSTKTIE